MRSVWNDIKYALRGLRRDPLFTLAVVLSLGAGMDANAAIFSLLDQVLLQSLPVRHPEQLVLVALRGKQYGGSWGPDHISYPIYKAFRDRNKLFSGMFCQYPLAITILAGNSTERIDAELISGTYYPVLGVGAALRRTLTPDDARVPGAHPVVMGSYGFWQTRFASDPAIIGQTIAINGHKFTMIGVAPRSFNGVELGYQTQLFLPMMMQGQVTHYWGGLHARYDSWITTFGRLKPGMDGAFNDEASDATGITNDQHGHAGNGCNVSLLLGVAVTSSTTRSALNVRGRGPGACRFAQRWRSKIELEDQTGQECRGSPVGRVYELTVL